MSIGEKLRTSSENSTTKSFDEFPYLSLAEKHDLIEHVEYLQPWLMDSEDDSTIGASHSMKMSQKL